MPRSSSTRVVDRQVSNPEYRSPTQTTVEARPVDFLSGSTPHPQGDLDGLLQGLQSFSPALQSMNQMAQQQADEDRKAGATVRAAGGAVDETKGQAWVHGYMALDGTIKGEQDAAEAATAYNTEFDKDNGNLDDFLNKRFAEKTKGLQAGAFLDGYSTSFTPALVKIREQHLEYQKNKVTATVESNAMQLMDGGMRAYINAGQPIPNEYLDAIKSHVGGTLGVSSTRFNDLVFASLKRLGDEGNYAVYDTLKRPNTDGSPGLYYDPAWKEKIDQAQIYANNVFIQKHDAAEKAAKRDREDAQDVAMMDVFMDPDPASATLKFNQHRKDGLFTRASEVIQWEKALTEKVDGKPDVNQLDEEMALLPMALTGSLKTSTIINSKLTRTQKMGLISKNKAAIDESRRLGVAAAANSNKWYNDPMFRSGMDYLETALAIRPTQDALGQMLTGAAPDGFDRQQLARARIDFVEAMKNRNPSEAHAVAAEITDRTLKQRQAFTPVQQKSVGIGGLPFSNTREVADALRKGLISTKEAGDYATYFENQRTQKPNAR